MPRQPARQWESKVPGSRAPEDRGFPPALLAATLLARALIPWALHFLKWGGPLSAVAMYRERGMDLTYLVAISGLARFGLAESSVIEHAGTGMVSFGLGTVPWLAAPYKALGPWAFIAIDALGAALNFAVLRSFLVSTGLRRRAAEAFSLLLMTGAMNKALGGAYAAASLLGPSAKAALILAAFGAFVALYNRTRLLAVAALTVMFFLSLSEASWLWLWWIPRQFIGGIYFLYLLTVLFRVWAGQRLGPWSWALVGVVAALHVQGSPHQAMITALLGGSVALVRRLRLAELAAFTAAFIPAMTPFAYQRIHENAEVVRRFGQFATGRWPLWHLPVSGLAAASAAALLGALYWRGRRLLALFLAMLVAAAYLAMPFNQILLGKLVQVQHYRELFFEVTGLACAVAFLGILAASSQALKPRWKTWIASIALIASGTAVLLEGWKAASMSGPTRLETGEWEDIQSYRKDFVDLVRYLEGLAPNRYKALASFDLQVDGWWSAFGGGFLTNPDPFFTTISDDEQETRFMKLCHLLGMSEGEFLSFVQKPPITVYLFTHAKYLANRGHTFVPLAEYSEEQRRIIRSKEIMDAWAVTIPPRELGRLAAKYRAVEKMADPQTDVIVVSPQEGVRGRTVVDARFAKTYSNPSFSVWLRNP